jgi:hypothetical protein
LGQPAMLVLNFREQIMSVPLAADVLDCLSTLIMYIIPCILIALPIRLFTKIPSFVFRKILHMINVI